jgi:hypothetical protein
LDQDRWSRPRKFTLLVSVPLGLTTRTGPVVAPVGTVVLIPVGNSTVKIAGVPLKPTLVAPVNFVPRMKTEATLQTELAGTARWTKPPQPSSVSDSAFYLD